MLVRVVTGQYVKTKFGVGWEHELPKCNKCATRIALDEGVVLMDEGGLRLRSEHFDFWMCESCARKRNLIW